MELWLRDAAFRHTGSAMSGNMQKVAVSVLAEDAVIVTDYDEFANALSVERRIL